MDGIHQMRDQYRADLVVLLVDEMGDSCGRAWIGYPPSTSHAAYGFSVVKKSCSLGNMSFAHELGPNLGLQHDRYVMARQPDSLYNFGFTNTDIKLRDVMAYSNECDDKSLVCPRYPSYSAPSVMEGKGGKGLGIPIGKPKAAHARNMFCNAVKMVGQYR
jgi:hypothetical protein